MAASLRIFAIMFFIFAGLSGAAAQPLSDTPAGLTARAKHHDAQAEFLLGWGYYEGRGVPRDYVSARQWFEKAAKQGNAAAQYYLGDIYEYGRGVKVNLARAAKWFRKSAEQDDPLAQSALAAMYAQGWGVKRDGEEACFWLMRASASARMSRTMNCDEVSSGLSPVQIQSARQRALNWHASGRIAAHPASAPQHSG